MQKTRLLTVLAVGLYLLLPGNVQAGSTLRCGSSLISTGDNRHQVLARCGEPAEQYPVGYREVVNRYGHVSDVLIEEWIYGPRSGMYHYLRFEGGYLVKITSSR